MEKILPIFEYIFVHSYLVFLTMGMELIINGILEEKKNWRRFWIRIGVIFFSLILSLYFHSLIFPLLLMILLYLYYVIRSSEVAEKLEIQEESAAIVSLLIGIGVAASALFMKGFNYQSLILAVGAVGAGLILTRLKLSSIWADIFLIISAFGVLFKGEFFIMFASVSLGVMVHFIVSDIIPKTRVESISRNEVFRGYGYAFLIVFLVGVIILSYSFIHTFTMDSFVYQARIKLQSVITSYSATVKSFYNNKEVMEKLLKDDYKPSIIKSAFVIKDSKVIMPSSFFGKSYKEIKEKFKDYEEFSTYINQNTFLVLFYRSPLMSFFSRSLLVIISSATIIVIGVIMLVNVLYRRWMTILEVEIMTKTQEITAANEELTAMNEELISMNEEIEGMYKTLLDQNNRIMEFLKFVRKIDIRENIDEVFRRMYEAIKGIVKVKPVGYDVVEMSTGVIKISYSVGKSVFSQDFKIGEYIFRVLYPEVVSLTEDEQMFLDMILIVSEIIISAHDNYVYVEKSRNFVSRVLDLLNTAFEIEDKSQLERVLLYNGFKLFDDVTIVAVAWKDECEDNVLVKFIRYDSLEVQKKYLVKGITKYALMTGEQYIVRNAEEDKIFYHECKKSKSAVAVPLKAKDKIIGVLEIERSTLNAFTEEDLNILNIFAKIIAVILQRYEYYTSLRSTFFGIVEALSYAVELKDPYTMGHSRRVADYAIKIAKEMHLSKETIETIELAALLHDIGKIGVRGSVLNKPTKLTMEEYEEVMKHPVLGEEIVGKVESLRKIAKIIRYHHERCDGRGYPDGLTCDQIPLESKIIAVADAFDAMTSDRPYRKALSVKKALEIIEKGKGKQWDPAVVDAAMKVFKELFKDKLNKDNEDNNS